MFFQTEIIGHLGQDAKLGERQNNRLPINFSIAHSYRFTDKETGEVRERTTWLDTTYWVEADKTGLLQYLKKGTLVFASGEVNARAWADSRTGEQRAGLSLAARTVRLLKSTAEVQAATATQEKSVAEITEDLPF
ncbi:MAG: single-stranded DNA-binding protein [Pseudomonadota bacterium]|jgi:single-strand DNA-binding protein